MKKPATLLMPALAVLTCSAAALCGEISDWPHWMGPDRDGTSPETGLLRQWPQGGPPRLWEAAVPQGYGPPTVTGGQVFLLGGGKGGRTVLALDAFTGRKVWDFSYKGSTETVSWGYCTRAMVAAGKDRVWSLDELGLMYCLDRKTGKELWKKDLDAQIKPSHSDWKGWCCSPVLAGGLVIVKAANAGVVALKPDTGQVVWTSGPKTRFPYQTPQVVRFGGEECVVVSLERPTSLVALRARDGAEVWKSAVGKGSAAPAAASPILVAGRFILETPRKAPAGLIEVDLERPPFKSKTTWQTDKLKACYAAWVRQGEHIYGFNHAPKPRVSGPYLLTCVNLSTGAIKWEKDDFKKGVSLIAADGLLIARSKSELILFEATPRAPVEKGRMDLGFRGDDGWVLPALAYGRLYVRSKGKLLCLQVAAKAPSAAQAARALSKKR